jgi:O-methyltransferase involved in polyketide biosynthesis
MSPEESYAQISPTARVASYLRTFTDTPFAREIAAACAAEEATRAFSASFPESITGIIPRAEMRYKITNQLIARQGITQVLEIAAGLSPRGLALTADPQVVYVATDLPEIIGQSQAIAETVLADLDLHRPNLSFRPANALHLAELMQAAASFRPDQPLAIVMEGLLMYLTRAEQATVAANIHALLTTYNGIWVTPDVYTSEKQFPQGVTGVISNVTGRNLDSNLFLDQDDVYQFFTGLGFNIEAHVATEVFEELSVFNFLDVSRETVLETARNLQAFIFTI